MIKDSPTLSAGGGISPTLPFVGSAFLARPFFLGEISSFFSAALATGAGALVVFLAGAADFLGDFGTGSFSL